MSPCQPGGIWGWQAPPEVQENKLGVTSWHCQDLCDWGSGSWGRDNLYVVFLRELARRADPGFQEKLKAIVAEFPDAEYREGPLKGMPSYYSPLSQISAIETLGYQATQNAIFLKIFNLSSILSRNLDSNHACVAPFESQYRLKY